MQLLWFCLLTCCRCSHARVRACSSDDRVHVNVSVSQASVWQVHALHPKVHLSRLPRQIGSAAVRHVWNGQRQPLLSVRSHSLPSRLGTGKKKEKNNKAPPTFWSFCTVESSKLYTVASRSHFVPCTLQCQCGNAGIQSILHFTFVLLGGENVLTKPQINVTFRDLRDSSLVTGVMRLAIIQPWEMNNQIK